MSQSLNPFVLINLIQRDSYLCLGLRYQEETLVWLISVCVYVLRNEKAVFYQSLLSLKRSNIHLSESTDIYEVSISHYENIWNTVLKIHTYAK